MSARLDAEQALVVVELLEHPRVGFELLCIFLAPGPGKVGEVTLPVTPVSEMERFHQDADDGSAQAPVLRARKLAQSVIQLLRNVSQRDPTHSTEL